MKINKIQSFLVEPGKGLDNLPPIHGKDIPLSGKIFDMLSEIFRDAESECDISVSFRMAEDGSQLNEVHSKIVEFSQKPELNIGMQIAERLCSCTTKRSDLGLLFLILGKEKDEIKLLISRFPADRGILVDKSDKGLSLKFIERIFMKNPNYYKAVFYRGRPILSDLWSGFAIDKQVSLSDYEIAQYWIQSFLCSDYRTTSKGGSMRFAKALLEASHSAKYLYIKQELTGLGLLIKGLNQEVISIDGIIDTYHISTDAKNEIYKHLQNPLSAQSPFVFDFDEFNKHAPYSSVELDNEGLLIAPSSKFSEVFSRNAVQGREGTFRFTTQGQIIGEQLRGRK